MIPRVTLCGWIKDDVREKWERTLKDEREGVHHDLTQAKHMIENWDMEESSAPAFVMRSGGLADFRRI